jgi:hypothetical protein
MLLPKTKLQELISYKWSESQKYTFTERRNDFICGIKEVLVKGKVHETVDILYVMTSKASSEMEIKEAIGKE